MHDPLDNIDLSGVAVAWTQSMERTVIWLPDDAIAVLNASVPRQRLADEIGFLMQVDPCGDGEPSYRDQP